MDNTVLAITGGVIGVAVLVGLYMSANSGSSSSNSGSSASEVNYGIGPGGRFQRISGGERERERERESRRKLSKKMKSAKRRK